MLDHVSIGVRDVAKAKRFYDAAMTPLGYACLSADEGSLGYGKDGVVFWINSAERPVADDPKSGLHFCFAAPNRASVAAFHAAALAHGGRDNGKPGLRKDYGPSYYAAVVFGEPSPAAFASNNLMPTSELVSFSILPAAEPPRRSQISSRRDGAHVHHHHQTDYLRRAVEASKRIAHGPSLPRPETPGAFRRTKPARGVTVQPDSQQLPIAVDPVALTDPNES